MMILALLLLFIPTVFQLVYGNKAIKESITMNLFTVSIISLGSQLVIPVLAALIGSIGFTGRCGLPLVGLAVSGYMLYPVLLVIIGIQWYVKRSYR